MVERYPQTFEDAAAALAAACAEGQAVRIQGAGTKRGWGLRGRPPEVTLHTTGLNRIREHNAGDFTAVLEAGTPLADAQRTFGQAGQRLALDPPLGPEQAATIGGVIATGDCGPLRHHYGAPRDMLLGMTVALSDGTIARSGGTVIKNVAGYDIAKLFAGSFGTLGMILAVNVRLHPLPVSTATASGASHDPDALAAAARALAAAPLELEALDVVWRAGRGSLLARSAGARPTTRAQRAASLMRETGLASVEVLDDDDRLWASERDAQRSSDGAIVRIASRPSVLAEVLRATGSCGGALVGRAALGTHYVELAPEPHLITALRGRLPPGATSVLLDAPAAPLRELDPWGAQEVAPLALMRRVKARFDPAGSCNPGVFVGGM